MTVDENSTTPDEITQPDLNATAADLKAYLAAKNVAFGASDNKATLQHLAGLN